MKGRWPERTKGKVVHSRGSRGESKPHGNSFATISNWVLTYE